MDQIPVTGRTRGSAPTRMRVWLVVALLVYTQTVFAQQELAARSAAPVTFLQINDVYTTSPVDGLGGLARVATLKKNLADAGRTPFLVIAGSDAKFVARIDVNQRPGDTVERFYELLPITSALPDDPNTNGVIASYETRLGTALDTIVGVTRVPLDGLSIHLRSSETNLGDLVADAIRADATTDIAITNSGSIRGNRVFPAGPLTRRTLVEIHPFDNVICTLALPGRVVLEALNHGVSSLPTAQGMFPQVSGLTMVVDPNARAGDRVRDVRVNGQPLDPNKTHTVAVPDFVLKQGDGYTMFSGQPVRVGPEAGNLISSALEKYVAAKREIAPAVEGRITIR